MITAVRGVANGRHLAGIRRAAVLGLACGWFGGALAWQPAAQAAQVKATPTLEQLWAELGNLDPARAERAVDLMAKSPEKAVPFLKARLRPVKSDPQRTARWIADLGSPMFAVRQEATAGLEYISPFVRADLRKALREKPPLEAALRIEQLLRRSQQPILLPDALVKKPGAKPPGMPGAPYPEMPGGGAIRPGPGDRPDGPPPDPAGPGPGWALPGGPGDPLLPPVPKGFPGDAPMPGGPPGGGPGGKLPPPGGGLPPGGMPAPPGILPSDPVGPGMPGAGHPGMGGPGPYGGRLTLAVWLPPARAAAVLERIGTPEAVAILQSLAQGEAQALPTEEAQAALKRLKK